MTMPTQPTPVASYASPGVGRPRSRSLAAPIVLCVLGVIMIVLGGCFLIGVAEILFNPFAGQVSPLQRGYGESFIVALYICAGACFLAAIGFLWAGVRRLIMLID